MFKSFTFLALASLLCLPCRAEWTGWHPWAWSAYRTPTNQSVEMVQVWCVSNTFLVTNFYGSVPFILTNRFTDAHHFQRPSEYLTNTYTMTTRSNGAAVSYSVTVTNPTIPSSVAIEPREILARDCYRAIRERMQALTNETAVDARMRSFPPVYRAERDALTWAKDWIEEYGTSRWVRADLATTNADYVAQFKASPTNSPPLYTLGELLTDCPSNYLNQTPWRELLCMDVGRTRVLTCALSFAASGIYTVQNCCGQSTTITATNGQQTTLVCTNGEPWATAGDAWTNATAEAWGWCKITNILARMIHTTSGREGQSLVTSVSYDPFIAPACLTSNLAIAAVQTAYATGADASCDPLDTNLAPAYVYSESFGTDFSGAAIQPHQLFWVNGTATNAWTADALATSITNQHTIGAASSNLTHYADLYVSCPTSYPAGAPSGGGYQYDDYGYGFTTNLSVLVSVSGSNTQNSGILIGYDPTFTPTTCPAVPTDTSLGLHVRGFYGVQSFWVIRWNAPGGFAYK